MPKEYKEFKHLDCKSNGCLFAFPLTGMRTNGPCGCIDGSRISQERIRFWARNVLPRLRKENAELNKQLGYEPDDLQAIIARINTDAYKLKARYEVDANQAESQLDSYVSTTKELTKALQTIAILKREALKHEKP